MNFGNKETTVNMVQSNDTERDTPKKTKSKWSVLTVFI